MQQMTFLYTAFGIFDKSFKSGWPNWYDYIKWSKMTHLTEVVSLDGMLNKILIETVNFVPDYWNFVYKDGQYLTNFFTSLEYVLKKTQKVKKFNLLTVVVNPNQNCNDIPLEDYEFVGYELLDRDYCNSTLTNYGGFDEIFLPSELNQFGLITDYSKAFDIKRALFEILPVERQVDTIVIAVWRHKTIGRKKLNR